MQKTLSNKLSFSLISVETIEDNCGLASHICLCICGVRCAGSLFVAEMDSIRHTSLEPSSIVTVESSLSFNEWRECLIPQNIVYVKCIVYKHTVCFNSTNEVREIGKVTCISLAQRTF